MRFLRLDRGTPETLPITVEEVRDQARILDNQFDEQINDIHIPAAVNWAEGFMRRNIVARTATWIIDDFPRTVDEGLRLPLGKTQSVTSIAYVSNNATTTMTGSSTSPVGTDYREDLTGDSGGVLYPAYTESWPSVDFNTPTPITITFSAGWTASEIPAQIKHALLMYCVDALDVTGAHDAKNANLAAKEILLTSWRLIRS